MPQMHMRLSLWPLPAVLKHYSRCTPKIFGKLVTKTSLQCARCKKLPANNAFENGRSQASLCSLARAVHRERCRHEAPSHCPCCARERGRRSWWTANPETVAAYPRVAHHEEPTSRRVRGTSLGHRQPVRGVV